MNWSEMSGGWNEMKPLVQSYWPRIADVMLRDINGDPVGKVTEELRAEVPAEKGLARESRGAAISTFGTRWNLTYGRDHV